MINSMCIIGIEKLVVSTTILKDIDLNTGLVRTLVRYYANGYAMAFDHKENYMYVPIYGAGEIVR